MLGEMAFVKAAEAWAEVLGGNFAKIPAAVAWAALGTAAEGAAGAIRALAEGGIVTKPTRALIGERGPEAVIPLSGGNGRGLLGAPITIIINGTVMEEEGIARKIGKVLARQYRGW
jgi:hypothetical protein